MQLLHASPLTGPEFVSMSILLKPSSSDETVVPMGEPMMAVSPVTTISSSDSLDALRELHCYLTTLLKASSASKKAPPDDRLTPFLYREDEKQLLDQMQIFRPLSAQGLGLHYRLIRSDSKIVTNLASLILASYKSSASQTGLASTSDVLGVVLCVGMSGLPFAHASSPLQYSLAQRMNDCVGLLARAKASEIASIKVLLSTLLLSDEDSLTTNEMVEERCILPVADEDEADDKKGVASVMSPIGGVLNTAVKASKRMSVTMNIATPTKNGMNPAVVEQTGVPLALTTSSAEAARVMTERLTVMSAVETDTFLRKYISTGQERKANLDLTGGSKSRFRRRKADGRDADFDNFDYKGPAKEKGLEIKIEHSSQPIQSQPIAALPKSDQKLQLRKKDTRSKSGIGRRMSNQSNAMAEQAPPRTKSLMDKDGKLDLFGNGNGAMPRNGHDDMTFAGESTVASQGRLQVNIALNEDLACSYKLSQLSSCSVEGVVQIQVKYSHRSPIPFFLLIKDLSEHIESLQENKKFAVDVSDSLIQDEEDDVMDYKFTVTVPKADNYVPVLRYKCVSELRPVPIRVQTKVKTDSGFCRVALQISSNPNNEATLTDLTIIMGVPDTVIGESLLSQPPGGVWNESKRSVIWCVSELGDGEKFQLQARFEMAHEQARSKNPDFPVLVRSQCLFAQLSDLELEIRDIPETHPADIAMKLARRFRLSHRERS